jgi:DNA adenine methylase
MGSKNRIAKYLLPIILKDRKEGQWYVEPFVGGANMIDKVDGNRIGADKNEFLIEMWKGLQENRERPYKIEKELYNKARDSYNKKDYSLFDKFMIGWVGWMGSYNGRFFDGGYSGHSVGKRDYISEQIKNTEAQIENIKNIEFIISSYADLKIPENSIIYCDIPYKDTKQYITSKDFDHTKFWDWCREKSKEGHQVFISEYNAPDDFECIWQMEVTNSMNTTKTYKPIEKLFIYKV